MPLDTGAITPEMLATYGVDNDETADVAPSLETLAFTSTTIGAGLKAAREFKGLSLQDVADATRVRRHYLACIESMEIGQLPSRPFAIGYIRAYARVLGVDEERAVARFKEDVPEPEDGLREPVGVSNDRDPRFGLLVVGAAVVIGAIVLWNVAQRGMAAKAPPAPAAVTAPPLTPPPPAQVALGEALPAPVESTIPPPYVTPGLEAEAGVEPAGGVRQMLPEAPVMNPRAAAYGAPPEQSAVMLRARKSASLIVRGPDGAPQFVHQLGESEVYRAPLTPGLSLDVSDPAAFDVFVRGQFIGQLPDLTTPLAKLGG